MIDLNPNLTGRTALVTGSAKRVGREVLLNLADAGADVAVHYRESKTEAEETADAARDLGARATTVQGDITVSQEVDSLVEDCESTLGSVDILINTVGPFPRGNWDELSFNEWKRTIEGCLYGTYLCSQRVLPAMRQEEWGRIINFGVADARDDHSLPLNFPYFAAKKAVLMFTRALAYDTQYDGITVNTVSPFVVENSVVDVVDLPRNRPASFEDVAAPILFFCSDAASYLSGQNIAVDGGRLHEA
ncbi:SDR family NAD(P)-dependent oxidoreductase [Salinarchaeum sp. IM2453]|uniref:SDR family NAD(P)-dependent oxidoreductase n=1 Tax=Salinarchaeum sp. IM2453 TaxID=2862870 RepID=UPI002175307F|nr:SDR family oxidoreductase [Salinarchaeum sp. IM2453]